MGDEVKVSWHIISQTESSGQRPDGSYGAGYRVAFQTEAGLIGSVFVPKEQYNTNSVLTAVRKEAKILTEVQSLEE